MRLEVIWGAREVELDGDVVVIERAIGLSAEDLADADFPSGVTIRASHGSVRKGAAGTGVAVVLEVAEHALNDVASLIGIGYALRTLISKISQRRGDEPAGAGAISLAALAAARTPTISDDPNGWYHTRTVPLTTDGSVGTDMRDVWTSAFLNESRGVVQLVFSSSTTRYLGSALVPTEWYFDGSAGRVRTDDELADQLDAWFAP